MKNVIKIALLIIFFPIALFAQQDNVIVMVDISGSVPKYIDNPTRVATVIKDLLQYRTITETEFRLELAKGASINEKMTGIGNKMIIFPFGDQATDKKSRSASPLEIRNETDVDNFIANGYPKTFPDYKTYRTLAMARCAELAKRSGLSSYWLLIASDITGDDFSGGAAYYSTEEEDLIKSYKSPSNRVDETKYGIVRYSGNNNFVIDIYKVSLGGYVPPSSASTGTSTSPTIQDNQGCKVTLNSFAGGTTNKPKTVTQNPFSISWSCNCDSIQAFRVGISGLDGSKVDNEKRNKQYNVKNATLDLEDGKYRITVTGNGASSATTIVEVDTGGGMLIPILLILAAAAGGGYYFWNKSRENRTDSISNTSSSRSSGSKSNSDDDIVL